MKDDPKPRFSMRLKPEDVALLEPLRLALGYRSHGAVARKALRDLADAKLKPSNPA